MLYTIIGTEIVSFYGIIKVAVVGDNRANIPVSQMHAAIFPRSCFYVSTHLSFCLYCQELFMVMEY